MPHINGIALYEELAVQCNYASNIVACFFIISGVFLYRSFSSKSNPPIFDYILNRIVRLGPLLVSAIILEAILNKSINWERSIINAFFLQCSGLSLEYRGILWYVSSYFFVSIFYYAVLASFSRRSALLFISTLTYFSLVFRINYLNGSIGGRETIFYVFNLGILRAVGEIGCGILLAVIYENLHRMKTVCPSKHNWLAISFLLKFTEVGAMVWLLNYFLFSQHVKNHIILIIAFSVLLLIMLSSNSLLGRLFQHPCLGKLGKYSYAIYVMQQTSFLILKRTLWLNSTLVAIPWLTLSTSVLFSVLLGVIAYHLIEEPCTKIYHNWYKRYMHAISNII